MEISCIECGCKFKVAKSRAETAKFCSYKCRGQWRTKNFSGDKNPNWKGGDRSDKKCQHCGKMFSKDKRKPLVTFQNQKFCSKDCADKGGFRYSGKDHPNYREGARRKNRGDGHAKWAKDIISRDNATCQMCGDSEVELHAHHIKPYKEFPELRLDVSNGITLCYKCHWEVHTAQNDNGMNSGKLLTGGAEDNPEPSFDGNIIEGVTTRGRAYRRWNGHCDWCKKFLSKRLSDVHDYNFCSYSCSGKHRAKYSGAFGHPKAVIPPRASHAKAKI